jgi:hypothetical protein
MAGLAWLGSAQAQTFVGTNLGPIPDGIATAPLSYGAPRDIRFNVSSIPGSVFAVTVEFRVNHSWVGDLKVQLVAPDGRVHLLMERTGATTATGCGYPADLSDANLLRFGDGAGSTNWWAAANAGNGVVAAGSYFTAPSGGEGVAALPPPTSTNAVVRTALPAGVWTLRFEDGCAGDVGAVTAANLIITPWGRDREVTDLIDSGPGTLRDRLNDALPGDVIRFPFGGTVALLTRLPVIPNGVTIVGPGADQLFIVAPGSRIFQTTPGSVNTIAGLSLIGGIETGGFGGAIFNEGTLHLLDIWMDSNRANAGGGVYNSETGNLTMLRCTLTNNTADTDGGGLYNIVRGVDRVYNSTFANNQALNVGGGVVSASFGDVGGLDFRNNTVMFNTAGGVGPGFLAFVAFGGDNRSRLSSNLFTGVAPTLLTIDGAEIVSEGYNLSTDNPAALLNQPTDRLNANAGVVGVDFNGAPTPTATLQPDSDAIDTGRVVGLLLTDGRGDGFPRISGQPDPTVVGGDGSDIGAYERRSDPLFSDGFED